MFSEFLSLLSTLDPVLYCWKVVWAPTFFGHAKFEVKIFSEFFQLQSAVDAEFFTGGSGYQLFFVHIKFKVTNFSEFFQLQSAVDY